jgi:hypothetical protein
MLMRQIYESACPVLVYLGEANESRELVILFESIFRFYRLRKAEIENENTTSHKIDWANLAQYGLPDVECAQWQHLVHLLEHPWFSRVWTFQESLVARRCTFMYGDFSIDDQDFYAALHIMHQYDFARYVDRRPSLRISPVTASIQRCMSIFWHQGPVACRSTDQNWSPSPLTQLLRENLGSCASNPCDHVFALLGVSNEAEEPALRPNYVETLDQTYLRVAKYMVENGCGPLLLNSASGNREPDTLGSTLPSWIPRWNEEDSNLILPYLPRDIRVSKIFMAAGQTAQAFRIQKNQNTLAVRGIVLDTIERVGTCRFIVKSVEDMEHEDSQLEMTVACLAETLEMLSSTKKSYPSGEPTSEVLCRVSVCDRPGRDRKAPREYQMGLKAFVLFMANQLSQSGQFSACVGQLASCV